VEQPGVALVDVAEAAGVVSAWCGAVIEALAPKPECEPWAVAARAGLEALASPDRQTARLQIAAGLDIAAAARHLRRLAGLAADGIEATVRSLLGLEGPAEGGLYAVLPPPVLLYRSVSPALSEIDLHRLIDLARRPGAAAASRLGELREPARCLGTPSDITQDGLDRALALRDALGLGHELPLTGSHDLERELLPALGVEIADVHLDDTGVDGAAIFRLGRAPLIAINRSGRYARSPWGRRMTLAHELCHLLYDGQGADGTVGIVFNPWAPYPLERRANAFAAMLLAPEAAIETVLTHDSELWTASDLRAAMAFLGVGANTLAWHLYNLRWIGASERDAWLDELSSR
jgi:Zn-dependent peptidase ImmA (M78 family)